MELCRLFGYSKQAYYKRKMRSTPFAQHQNVLQSVQRIRQQLPRCGARKLQYMLNTAEASKGKKVGRDYLFSLLRNHGLLIGKRKKYHKTTNSKHWMRKYPNIIKELEIVRPEQVWVADITYLELEDEHQYLHLITDAYSKRIVGYELADNMRATTTIKALQRALNQREYQEKLIHNSDRGLQYSSAMYTKLLLDNKIGISMTEESDPYENAVAERVNVILKDEFGLDKVFTHSAQMKRQVDQSIALYNQLRPHLSIDMLAPNQAHK
ncbi:transposase [Owenweeksia hongkongensis DSM 17368]|uniref:Transposase n=2 Tax=Owenweeksia TaxID=267986 RepID=G8QZY6_OWEHD|nr:transposase [Owenweeksia hongkongensis DSM 17368]